MSAATARSRQLAAGQVVVTTVVDGQDFGIPLVHPTHRVRGRVYRTVRNAVRCQGGTVVWFTDGTKSRPLDGRVVWLLAEPVESNI